MTGLAAVLDFMSLAFGLWLLIGFLAWLCELPGKLNAEIPNLWPGTKEFCALCALMIVPGLVLMWGSPLLAMLSTLVIAVLWPEREASAVGHSDDEPFDGNMDRDTADLMARDDPGSGDEGDTPDLLLTLEAAMVAAHPDNGGSTAAFIKARADYIAARRARMILIVTETTQESSRYERISR